MAPKSTSSFRMHHFLAHFNNGGHDIGGVLEYSTMIPRSVLQHG